MRYGTVVQYFPEKGFGFIRPDDGQDVFFHVTALGACESQPEIKSGQPVKYELMSREEARAQSAPERSGGDPAKRKSADRPRAKMVELIKKIPGARLEDSTGTRGTTRHPRAMQKKPRWRR